MNLGSAMTRLMIALSQTRTVLILGLVGSWAGQVPGVLLCVYFWRKDVVGLYTGMCAGYALLNVA